MIKRLFILFTCVFVSIHCCMAIRVAQKAAVKAIVLCEGFFSMPNPDLKFRLVERSNLNISGSYNPQDNNGSFGHWLDNACYANALTDISSASVSDEESDV